MSLEKPAASSVAPAPGFRRASAPFLVWPVSRREFYRTICLALIPSFAWGVTLFGSRTLAMLLLAIAATSFTYFLLKRWLRWKRARPLLYVHCLLSVLVLVALAHPTWPVWIITAGALLLPAILALLGGPGRERIHVAVAMALAIQYILLPALPAATYKGKADAILARDRLVMGDIRNQADDPAAIAMASWPSSRDVGGDDAIVFPPPALAAANTLNQLSDMLPALGQAAPASPQPRPAAATGRAPGPAGPTSLPHNDPSTTTAPSAARPAGPAITPLPEPEDQLLTRRDLTNIGAVLDRAFVSRLPGIESFLWGVAPNRIGAASLVGLIFAGLYLSYRYILRPRSALLFLSAFIGATALFIFTPAAAARVGPLMLWEVVKQFPGQIVTLFCFLLLNSDAAFAGLIILALPGTEPLTPRARRIFLTLAAFAAAGLHRLDPTTPAATLTLCLLMPAAPLFDRFFAQRSWLNGVSRLPPSPPATPAARAPASS